LNTPNHEEPAWLSRDGLRLYCMAIKDGNVDILYATREERVFDSKWKWFDSLEEFREINTEYEEQNPSLTPDELEIFFSSDRPRGCGSWDIWVAARPDRDSPWGKPRNVKEINSPAVEAWPCVSSDGLTLWWTEVSTKDILYSTRPSKKDPFEKPRRLGSPVNTLAWDVQFEVSPDWPKPGAVAYFVRGRSIKSVDIYCAEWITSRDKQYKGPKRK
jgi:hypothetical protein